MIFSIAKGLILSPEYTGTHWYTPKSIEIFKDSSELSGIRRENMTHVYIEIDITYIWRKMENAPMKVNLIIT